MERETLTISPTGLTKIENYEGWGRLIKEGPNKGCYCAYQDRYHGKLDKPTIGPGLTEDVHMGMVLTRDECSARFRKELAKHEAAVNRLVTVEMSQNEFDAMVSLSYNVGTGAFGRSTVLRRLNKGDRTGAAKAFHLFNKAGGGVVAGLVQRRASEAALFLKPDAAPDHPAMPQTVTESKEPPSRTTVGTIAASAAAAATTVAPSIPAPPKEALEAVTGWQNAAETLQNFAHSPGAAIAVCGILIVIIAPIVMRRLA